MKICLLLFLIFILETFSIKMPRFKKDNLLALQKKKLMKLHKKNLIGLQKNKKREQDDGDTLIFTEHSGPLY